MTAREPRYEARRLADTAEVESLMGDIYEAAGDSVNAVAASTSNVLLSVATGSTVPTDLSFDIATGNVSVLAGSPAGTYRFNYQICEMLNPANCQAAAVTVGVDPSAIIAVNIGVNNINGAAGAANVANAFNGNSINGIAATAANALLSVAAGSSVPSGLSFDTNSGNISVTAATPAGTYSFNYQICEALNPTNCRIATVTVAIDSSLIVATPDSVSAINGASGAGDVVNAFGGDFVGATPASAANAILSIASGSTVPTGLVFDVTSGAVSVTAQTPAGTYAFNYQLCERLNPANCGIATISVNVAASIVVATADAAAGVNGTTGASNVINVFSGDSIDGGPATATNAVIGIAPGGAVPTGLTFDVVTGDVSVAAGTSAGAYLFEYQLCEALNPTNCKTAAASVTVDAANVLVTADTASSINGASGAANVLNVFAGDTINGAAATPSNAIISIAAGARLAPGLTFDTSSGNVSISPGTAAGTYGFTYQLCETLNPTNCGTASVSVVVDASALTVATITASGINGASGASAIANGFSGNSVNSTAATSINAELSVAAGSNVPSGLVFDTGTGDVGVVAGTAAGTYTFAYQLCENLNPTNCRTANWKPRCSTEWGIE